jgi:PST family polysaccharide transporter
MIGIMMSALAVSALVGSLGLGTSVSTVIGSAVGAEDRERARRAQRIARRLGIPTAAAVAAGLTLFSDRIAPILFGAAASSVYVVAIGVAAAFTALAHIETGILNGHRQLRTVSVANVLVAAIGTVLGIAAVMAAGVHGFALAVVATGLAHYLITRIFARVADELPYISDSAAATDRLAVRMVKLAAPVALSQLLIVAAQLLIPVLILQSLGTSEVGLYRAAAMISISYMTLVFGTLSYEFLPRLAGVSPTQLAATIDQHMRFLFSVAVPVILSLVVFGPIVIRLLFSDDFLPAATVLRWLLIGDLLRIPSWTLAFSLIARGRSGPYFILEAVGGVATLAGAWVGLQLAGLEGTAIGYAGAQGVYLAVAWVMTLRLGITAPGRLQVAIVGIAAGASVMLVLPVPETLRTSLLVLTAIAAAAAGARRLISDARQPAS